MTMKEHAPILKVAVFVDGHFTVDGAQSSIPSLRVALHELSKEHGAVGYYRESGQQEPPPVAMEVLNELMTARLPIRLSSKADYSDSVGSP
jgi:hypothetical protein